MERPWQPHERAEVDGRLPVTVPTLVRSVFGDEVVDRDFHGYEHAVSVHLGETMIGYVGVTDRVITLIDSAETVAGIGFVCTHPDCRNRGVMTFAMNIAHEEARRRGLSFALLNTGTPRLYPRYRSAANLPLGWLVSELGALAWPDDLPVNLLGSW
ncbi:MAG: Acetyltransferase domain [Acidimicrobiaceae bacterium]|nr:Acetyltransferase domain [Acidimicrobiaceae bacterium]